MKGRKLKIVSFKLDERELEILDRYAENHGMSRSEVIRRALFKIISQENDENNEDHEIKILRRGLPTFIESDNNIEYIGKEKDLKEDHFKRNRVEIAVRDLS
ncbi:MAG: DUF6290 family protein [Sulfolobales archaeon]